MLKTTLFTGFAVTGTLTLGHYCGLINYIISIQEEKEVIIMIADLHGLTIPNPNFDYFQESKKMIALLYACGLNKCKFFIQSQITEHLELFFFLSSYISVGSLKNMIQYKEKSKKKESDNLSLFSYPVLMAADILLYDVNFVIVGEDQKQHLELTSKIVKKLNYLLQTELTIPRFIFLYPGSKIMSLSDPTKKMSKSEKDSLFLLDSLEFIQKKIMSAKTDNQNKIFYDPLTKPGISNLLMIYSIISNKNIDILEKEFVNTNYFEFKKQIIFLLEKKLKIIKENYFDCLPKVNDLLVRDYSYLKEKASKKIFLIKKKLKLV